MFVQDAAILDVKVKNPKQDEWNFGGSRPFCRNAITRTVTFSNHKIEWILLLQCNIPHALQKKTFSHS